MRKTLIKRKKSGKSRLNRNRRTRKMVKRGGGIGSNIRQELVTLCRQGKWAEYDDLTQRIIKEQDVLTQHNPDIKHDYFIHLEKNIKTFGRDTLRCLERNLTQLQEQGIPPSMQHLEYVTDVRDGRIIITKP
jgi:hypothetical protein